MILSVGEILADMIGEQTDEGMIYRSFCGGAPFNFAVAAKRAGASVGFVGKVGNDPVGKFLIREAGKYGLDSLYIDTDEVRNTTLAFVTLDNGERDFAFFRHDTADYHIDVSKIDFNNPKLSTLHVGSLMLSEPDGQMVAGELLIEAHKRGIRISFDMNFRMDLYADFEEAKQAYLPYVEYADILKFSEDELYAYTGTEDIEEAARAVYKKDRLLVVTMGSAGSMYFWNDEAALVPTVAVRPVDTTGAGDAFFGTLVGLLDGKEYTVSLIESAMRKANKAGALATQFKGAIKL